MIGAVKMAEAVKYVIVNEKDALINEPPESSLKAEHKGKLYTRKQSEELMHIRREEAEAVAGKRLSVREYDRLLNKWSKQTMYCLYDIYKDTCMWVKPKELAEMLKSGIRISMASIDKNRIIHLDYEYIRSGSIIAVGYSRKGIKFVTPDMVKFSISYEMLDFISYKCPMIQKDGDLAVCFGVVNLEWMTQDEARQHGLRYYDEREYDGIDKLRAKLKLMGMCGIDGYGAPLVDGNMESLTVNGRCRSITPYMMSMASIKHVVLKEGVENICSNAFAACTVYSICMPSTLKYIGADAMSDTEIKKLNIPGSVEKIGNSAFMGCVMLKNAVINDGVKEIGAGVFSNCIRLKEIWLPGSLRKIGDTNTVSELVFNTEGFKHDVIVHIPRRAVEAGIKVNKAFYTEKMHVVIGD